MKRTRLRPMSAKTRARIPGRQECRRIVIERDKTCRFWAAFNFMPPGEYEVPPCGGRPEVHEPARRGNCDFTDPAECILLCERHHAWVGRNIDLARRIGLYVDAVGRPTSKGLLHTRGEQ